MDNFKSPINNRRSLDGFKPVERNKRLNNTTSRPTTISRSNILSNIPQKSSNISNRPGPSLVGLTLPNNYSKSNNFSKVKQPKMKRKKSFRRKLFLSFTGFAVVLLISVVGFIAYQGFSTVDKVFHGNIVSDITAPFNNTQLKGESSGRVNFLLAGDSVGDPNHQGAQLTDSMIILSLNVKTRTAFLLSIPRDLWIYIPGLSSYQKINAANDVTNFSASGYPNGGMGELEQVIQTQLGIPIDYYGLINYTAFSDAVNSVGGVTINIQSPDPRGLYDPYTNIKLPNGPVTLNGQQALNLARARGDGPGAYGFPQSDFDRTAHQRQLLTAVAEKALSLGFLSNPAKISNLFNAFGNNLQTDLSLQNVLRLIQLAKNINPNSIQSYAFSYGSTNNHPKPILTGYLDPSSGQDALIPTLGVGNYSALTSYYKQLTSNNPLIQESAPIVILNASNQVGLAAKEAAVLRKQGYNIETIANASTTYPTSMIVNGSNGQEPQTLNALTKTFSSQATITSTVSYSGESAEAGNYFASFVIILGNNFKVN